MTKKDYSEDRLIQVPTVELLEQQLGWQAVFAQDEEDFGEGSLLGRHDDTDVVLVREVRAALERLNPGLPPEAYAQALALVQQQDITKTLVQINEEKYRLLRDGVPVKFRDAAGRLVDRRLRLIDFDRPDQNRYLAVRELWVRGRLHLRRPDVIGYLDKPMQGHTLMQAIARVNRVGGGKKLGLIVDYNGMLRSLRRALATFAQGDRGGTGKGEDEEDTVRDDAAALAEYADSLKQARDYLAGLGFELEALIAARKFERQGLILSAVNLLCGTDERRKTYQVIVEDVQARHRALFPNPGLAAHDAEESAISAIFSKMMQARKAPDVSALLQDLYDVVDTAVVTETPVAQEPPVRYDLSRIDVDRLRAEFEKTPFKHVVEVNLKERIEERLRLMLMRNPTRVDLYQRYQEIVQAYNKDKDAAEVQKVMDDLLAFHDRLDEEEKRYLREGLDNEEQLAVFDLLQKGKLTRGNREAIKKAAKELLQKLSSGKLQIDHWREKAAAQAQVKAEIIKHLFANLPSEDYDADEISLKAGEVFAHLYTTRPGSDMRVYH